MAPLVQRGHKVLPVPPDLPEKMDTKARRAKLDRWVLPVLPDTPGKMDTKARWAMLGQWVRRVLPALSEKTDTKVRTARSALRDLPVWQVRTGTTERWDRRVHKAPPVLPVLRARMARRA